MRVTDKRIWDGLKFGAGISLVACVMGGMLFVMIVDGDAALEADRVQKEELSDFLETKCAPSGLYYLAGRHFIPIMKCDAEPPADMVKGRR